jgi:hypothetical protein
MSFRTTNGKRVYSYFKRDHRNGDTVAVYINGDPDFITLAEIKSIKPAKTSGFIVVLKTDVFTFSQHMHYHSESFEFYIPHNEERRAEDKLRLGLGENASNSDFEAKREAMCDPEVAYNIEFTTGGIKTRNAFHRCRTLDTM